MVYTQLDRSKCGENRRCQGPKKSSLIPFQKTSQTQAGRQNKADLTVQDQDQDQEHGKVHKSRNSCTQESDRKQKLRKACTPECRCTKLG